MKGFLHWNTRVIPCKYKSQHTFVEDPHAKPQLPISFENERECSSYVKFDSLKLLTERWLNSAVLEMIQGLEIISRSHMSFHHLVHIWQSKVLKIKNYYLPDMQHAMKRHIHVYVRSTLLRLRRDI